jgi:two-component system response regulator
MNDGVIMLIEDDPDDVVLTVLALQRNDFTNEVVVARDGEQALDQLCPAGEGRRVTPALVLLDINIPKVRGLDVLRALRSDVRTRTLLVVVLTTSTEERDIVESYRLGANGYVRKPVAFSDFVAAIGLLGSYWLLVNELPPRQSGPG